MVMLTQSSLLLYHRPATKKLAAMHSYMLLLLIMATLCETLDPGGGGGKEKEQLRHGKSRCQKSPLPSWAPKFSIKTFYRTTFMCYLGCF
jgi:hypothetical protein